MPLKFYADEHIDQAVVDKLQKRDIDSVRCQDAGLIKAKDFEHLQYASAEYRSIITKDQDFRTLHTQYLREGRFHAGIFLITHDDESIGFIVNELAAWHEMVGNAPGVLESDIYNRLYYLARRAK